MDSRTADSESGLIRSFREFAESLPEIAFEMDTNGILTYANQRGFDEYKSVEIRLGN